MFVDGAEASTKYMKGLFDDWQAQGITSVLHEKRGGYANNVASMQGLAAKAEEPKGVRVLSGVEVLDFEFGSNSNAVTALNTNQGRIACETVVVGVGPWVNKIWNLLELPKKIDVKSNGTLHKDVPMWKFWCLEEGTLGVDPEMHKTNDGRFPPVLHVDTDAPLYSDRDGRLITDKIWGIYYKPDFNFGGIQGGASPYKVEQDPDQVAVDPYGAGIAGVRGRRGFRRYVVLGAGPLPEALRGQDAALQARGEIRRARLLHAGQFPGVRRVPRECLRHCRLQSRL